MLLALRVYIGCTKRRDAARHAQPFSIQHRLRNSAKSFLTLAYDNFADR